jgi:hypothetical protein
MIDYLQKEAILLSYFKMKFIDEICDKIVSPSKIRYATHDLGNPSDSQEAIIYSQESAQILLFLTIKGEPCREAFTKVI